VYVHVKDALGNTRTPYEVTVNTDGTALYIDSAAPSAGTVTPVLSSIVNNTVANAKIKFTPIDGGVGGIKYVVVLSGLSPDTDDWIDYTSGELEKDLSDFTGNIQTVYLYLKDALGNGATTAIPVTVHSGPLYIDRTPPTVSGGAINGSTGAITGITISDGTGNVAGFEYASGNYDLNSDASNAVALTLTDAGSTYSIAGGMPSPLPAAGSDSYIITLTVKDKGGVEESYTIGVTVTVAGDSTVSYALTSTWTPSGSPTIPPSMMAPFGFASPFSSPTGTNAPAAGTASTWSPAPVYGSTGGVRYQPAGLTRTPARSAGTAPRQSAAPASYAYSGENAEYLHVMRPYPGNSGSSGDSVPVTVVRSEPASLRPERPGRVRTAPQDSGPAESSYTEAPPAEEPEFEDYGPSLSAASLPADSPVPADFPPDNHKLPFRNSHFNPCILPPGGASGSRKSRDSGTKEE
jgi:hypothetical protein